MSAALLMICWILIYFVETDNKKGVKELYSLDDFSSRKLENIQKGYYQSMELCQL